MAPALGKFPLLELVPIRLRGSIANFPTRQIEYTLGINFYHQDIFVPECEGFYEECLYLIKTNTDLKQSVSAPLSYSGLTVGFSPVGHVKSSFEVTLPIYTSPRLTVYPQTEDLDDSKYTLLRKDLIDSLKGELGTMIKRWEFFDKGQRSQPTIGDLPYASVIPFGLDDEDITQFGGMVSYTIRLEVLTKWYSIMEGELIFDKVWKAVSSSNLFSLPATIGNVGIRFDDEMTVWTYDIFLRWKHR
ncbi:MAG: hypothetical protein K2X29_05505 [Candidatus Obscuribacterales bacterium]|nr:hypothetical protein [Candidatus Obscuribacterales bacterium]